MNFLSVLSLCPNIKRTVSFLVYKLSAQIPFKITWYEKTLWEVRAKWCEYIWSPWHTVNFPCGTKLNPKRCLIWELVNIASAYHNPTWAQNLNSLLPPKSMRRLRFFPCILFGHFLDRWAHIWEQFPERLQQAIKIENIDHLGETYPLSLFKPILGRWVQVAGRAGLPAHRPLLSS